MNQLLPTMRSRHISSIVLIVAIIALCFSVGEGLRLTPFPVLQRIQVDPATASSIAGASQLSVYTYGPLDVPTQPQKRSKRLAIDLLCPDSLHSDQLFTRLYPSTEHGPRAIASILLIAFPSDRAPPFTS
jgi:hypothetical protein